VYGSKSRFLIEKDFLNRQIARLRYNDGKGFHEPFFNRMKLFSLLTEDNKTLFKNGKQKNGWRQMERLTTNYQKRPVT